MASPSDSTSGTAGITQHQSLLTSVLSCRSATGGTERRRQILGRVWLCTRHCHPRGKSGRPQRGLSLLTSHPSDTVPIPSTPAFVCVLTYNYSGGFLTSKQMILAKFVYLNIFQPKPSNGKNSYSFVTAFLPFFFFSPPSLEESHFPYYQGKSHG